MWATAAVAACNNFWNCKIFVQLANGGTANWCRKEKSVTKGWKFIIMWTEKWRETRSKASDTTLKMHHNEWTDSQSVLCNVSLLSVFDRWNSFPRKCRFYDRLGKLTSNYTTLKRSCTIHFTVWCEFCLPLKTFRLIVERKTKMLRLI